MYLLFTICTCSGPCHFERLYLQLYLLSEEQLYLLSEEQIQMFADSSDPKMQSIRKCICSPLFTICKCLLFATFECLYLQMFTICNLRMSVFASVFAHQFLLFANVYYLQPSNVCICVCICKIGNCICKIGNKRANTDFRRQLRSVFPTLFEPSK